MMIDKIFHIIMPIVSRKKEDDRLRKAFIQMREESDRKKKAMKKHVRNSWKKNRSKKL